MKKIVLALSMLTAFVNAQAQLKSTAIEANLATYKGVSLGFGANAEIFFNEKFSAQPSFVYYLGNSAGTDINGNTMSSSAWGINADAHYYFKDLGKFRFYGIGGINFYQSRLTTNFGRTQSGIAINNTSVSESAVGVNVGAGAIYTRFFLEVKFNSALGALVNTVGYRFMRKN